MADGERDAGPSQPKRARFGPRADVASTSAAAMPAILDVERFANIRRAEINAMENAIKASRDSGAKRAFQSLPRHLRRRAASHNIRRLPKRLRAKAMMEIMHEQTRTSKKRKFRQLPLAKRRKLLRFSRLQILQHRQRHKAWLETHIWHAKRMKMQDWWGYRLAWTPTAKAFRPSYRAAAHGVIVHDCSYMQTIELKGQLKALQAILSLICDASAVSPAAQRYSNGLRICNTTLHACGSWPFDVLGPADIVWNASPPAESEETTLRQVLIRFHPSILFSVTTAVEAAIARFQAAAPDDLPIQDRPREVNFRNVAYYHRAFCSFEITGPLASDAIRACFRPIADKASKYSTQRSLTAAEAWQNLTSPSSIPEGTVISTDVYDPRLTFPPHPSKSRHAGPPKAVIPSESLADNRRFWSASVRKGLSVPKYSKLQLDERRKQLLLPGTALRTGPSDDRVPIMLIQRTVSCSTQASTSKDAHALSGWTLIVPAGWGSAFWHSLVYADTRVGGVRERAQQDFEAGVPSFPFDWLCTNAYANFTRKQAAEAEAKWERTPSGKRINYAHLGTNSPWKPDLDAIVARQVEQTSAAPKDAQEGSNEATMDDPEQRALFPLPSPAVPADSVPWLVPAKLVDTVVAKHRGRQSALDLAQIQTWLSQMLSDRISHFRAKRGLPDLPQESTMQAESRAFVHVILRPIQRGKPAPNAMIYVPTQGVGKTIREQLRTSHGDRTEHGPSRQRSSTAAQRQSNVTEQVGNKRRRLAGNVTHSPTVDDFADSLSSSDDEADSDDSDAALYAPIEDDLVGYLTSGNQSMARGHGLGIGAISLLGLLRIMEMEKAAPLRKSDMRLLVLYRNPANAKCRAATLQVVGA